jgi:hypothetical protein
VAVELDGLSVYVADKAYLYGIMSYDEKTVWLNNIKELASTIQSDELTVLKNSYSELLINTSVNSEAEATLVLDDIEELLLSTGNKFKSITDQYYELSIPNFIAPTELSLNLYKNNYSLFYGNTELGKVIDDIWVFDAKWRLLEDLIPFSGSLCTTSDDA